MSVILTVADTQSEEAADTDTECNLNGFQNQEEEEDDEDNAREAELIVFDGTTQGLGLKICGGCSVDGTQEDGIFIKRVLPGGLAHIQGGLEEGDLILDVNGQNMDGVTYDRALSVLRQASASDHVEVVITRDAEARAAFQDLMYRMAATNQKQESLPLKPTLNGNHVIKTDKLEEFQSHMEDFYKQTVGLRSDHPNTENGLGGGSDRMSEDFTPQVHQDEASSGQHSPASSCHSEVARHLSPASPEPADQHREITAANTRSPSSMLSPTFPMAFHSIHPGTRFPVAKLEMTLRSLGFVLSAQKHIELLKNIPIDSQGTTSFDDFVQAVRQVFHSELQTRSSSQSSTPPLLPCDSPAPSSPLQADRNFDGDSLLHQENERLRKEIETLKEELKEQKVLCKKAEEQLLTLRKESQTAIEESRSLRTKLRLAEQSQEAARKTEQDYEQVVTMLEDEISHLRLQISKSDGVMDQRRLAVAACQLKKAETGKKTLEVAANKLLAYVQRVQDVLSGDTTTSRSGDGDKKDRGAKQKGLQTLLSEGQDTIRTAQNLLEQVPLPFGWEENYTADGVRYYINHLNQTTSWNHPLTNKEHQSVALTAGGGASSQVTAAVEKEKK